MSTSTAPTQPEGICEQQKKKKKFVAVPDSRNVIKYLCASAAPPRQSDYPVELPLSSRTVSFQFGAVADVQFAHLPVARGVKHVSVGKRKVAVRRRRAWREAVPKLAQAVTAFNKAGVDFVLNLGDAIEGYGPSRMSQSRADLAEVMRAFAGAKANVYHVIGNHCRQLPMPLLMDAMSLTQPYYAFCPAPGWRCVVLHSAELSWSAQGMREEDRKVLKHIVQAEERVEHRFHGAIGDDQLAWFDEQLTEAEQANERMMVFSHYPLADGSARESHVLANTRAVRKIIERPGSPVALCLAGHDHIGTCSIAWAPFFPFCAGALDMHLADVYNFTLTSMCRWGLGRPGKRKSRGRHLRYHTGCTGST